VSSEPTEADPEGPDADARICTASDVAAQYKQHHESLRQFANRFFDGKRPDAAEDAVMAVFAHLVKLAGKQKLTDKGERWGAYLRGAVRRSCINIVRAETRDRERFPAGDPEQERIIDVDPLGDGVVADDQARRRLARLDGALATLEESQLAIVKHAFWDGWTNKKIGDTLGTSGQAVGQRLKTVLKRLHEEVTRDE
jgi:RNA polymerase sigma factor (sigma-70 family)